MTTATASGGGGRKRALPLPAASASAAEGSADGPAAAAAAAVAIVHAAADEEPISHEMPGVFQRLLAPVTVDQFLKSFYGPKRPLVVRGHDFGPLLEEGMEGGDVEALLEATPSEAISVWTIAAAAAGGAAAGVADGAAAATGGKISTARVQDARSAAALWRAGHSIYCRAPEPVERALVEAAVSALGLGFRTAEEGVRAVVEGEVELFMGRKGHRTPFHFDFQENFTLQLQGRKRWRLAPGVANPVRGCTPHYAQAEGVLDPAAEEQLKVHRLRDPAFRYGPPIGSGGNGGKEPITTTMEVVLEPGDFLYHPAGIWHAVECVGSSDSVSINVSLDGLTYADHIAGALRQTLMADARFTVLVQTGGPPTEALAHMASLLRDAAGRLEGLAAAPAALLPPALLWSQALPPLEAADGDGEAEAEAEAEEEDMGSVEEESEEEGADEEEDEEEDVGASFPHPVALGAVLRRNPLSALFALDDTDPGDAQQQQQQQQEEEDGESSAGGDGEKEAFMVHFAYGAGEELASVLRKKVVLGARLGRFLGQFPYGRAFTPAEVPGGDTPPGRRTLGALVHLGVLLLEEKREKEEEDGSGGSPQKKKGRR